MAGIFLINFPRRNLSVLLETMLLNIDHICKDGLLSKPYHDKEFNAFKTQFYLTEDRKNDFYLLLFHE